MSNDRSEPAKTAVAGQLERGVRRLAQDVARCAGSGEPGEWRDGCADCLRRTDRSMFPLQVWMAPPLIVVFECEARIAP